MRTLGTGSWSAAGLKRAWVAAERGVFSAFAGMAATSRAKSSSSFVAAIEGLLLWLQMVAFIVQPTVTWSPAIAPLLYAATATTVDPLLNVFPSWSTFVTLVIAAMTWVGVSVGLLLWTASALARADLKLWWVDTPV